MFLLSALQHLHSHPFPSQVSWLVSGQPKSIARGSTKLAGQPHWDQSPRRTEARIDLLLLLRNLSAPCLHRSRQPVADPPPSSDAFCDDRPGIALTIIACDQSRGTFCWRLQSFGFAMMSSRCHGIQRQSSKTSPVYWDCVDPRLAKISEVF